MNASLTRHRNLLLGYLRPQWPQVALLAVLLLSGIGLELLNPQILRAFIDTAAQGGAAVHRRGARAAASDGGCHLHEPERRLDCHQRATGRLAGALPGIGHGLPQGAFAG